MRDAVDLGSNAQKASSTTPVAIYNIGLELMDEETPSNPICSKETRIRSEDSCGPLGLSARMPPLGFNSQCFGTRPANEGKFPKLLGKNLFFLKISALLGWSEQPETINLASIQLFTCSP